LILRERSYPILTRPFQRGNERWNSDSLVKSPSAALRGNLAPLDKKPYSWDAGMKLLIFEGKNPFEKYLTGRIVAAHPQVRLTPQFLRALYGRGTRRVPDIGRDASRPYN